MPIIQIRDVPEDLHRVLKVRATAEGITLSELALNELRRVAERPSIDEPQARLAVRQTHEYHGETAAESVRAERESR